MSSKGYMIYKSQRARKFTVGCKPARVTLCSGILWSLGTLIQRQKLEIVLYEAEGAHDAARSVTLKHGGKN